MKLNVVDINGKETGAQEVNFLDRELDEGLVHSHYLVDKYQKANKRAGTASTKTKGEVSGGGAKPYKQKGTGNARRGSNRTPLRRGGGVIFGPKPRSYESKLNSKTVVLALRSVFSVKRDALVVLKSSDELIKTSAISKMLSSLKLAKDARVVFILDLNNDHNIELGARNLTNVTIVFSHRLPVSILLNAERIVMSENAMSTLKEKVLA